MCFISYQYELYKVNVKLTKIIPLSIIQIQPLLFIQQYYVNYVMLRGNFTGNNKTINSTV